MARYVVKLTVSATRMPEIQPGPDVERIMTVHAESFEELQRLLELFYETAKTLELESKAAHDA